MSGDITGGSIVETMGSGYGWAHPSATAGITKTPIYCGIVKNGNKLTFVWFIKLNRSAEVSDGVANCGYFWIPASVGQKLIPYTLAWLSDALYSSPITCYSNLSTPKTMHGHVRKDSDTQIQLLLAGVNELTLNTDYLMRFEATFLLSDNLAS